MRIQGLPKLPVLIIAFLFCIACSPKEVYFEYRSLENAQWERDDPAVFEVNVTDNSIPYDVAIEIRNTKNYPFSNIWLFVDYQTPGGNSRADTMEVALADDYGKWYGKGFSLHNLSIPYETSVLFPDTGMYVYSIRQGMRDNPLKGISDIGLKVSKKSDK